MFLRVFFILLCGVFFSFPENAYPAVDGNLFPVDESMRPRVDFWKRVYTEISSTEGFLHDPDDITVVYGKISYGHLSNRGRSRFVRSKKREVRDILRRIVQKKRQNLSPKESEIYAIVEGKSDRELLRMAMQVRRQQGMRDRYYDGLVRAQPYMEQIRSILKEEGVPVELAYLPHVESSFNYRAYSKVGAAGMWQFMRATARRYRMKINYVLDERRDPVISTRAAARFLRDNYDRLKAWPLAITAYNHGPASIARAVRTVGTRDISAIIDSYRARNFGFASKNFYASFMATVEISEESSKYFPNVQPSILPATIEIRLNNRLTAKEIAKVANISVDEFQDLNLALRPSVFRNQIRLPKGMKIRVPVSTVVDADAFLAKLAAIEVKPISIPSTRVHRVRRGQNLYAIAKRYNVPIRDVILLNEIEDPSLLVPGMRIKVPGRGKAWERERAELYARVEAKAEEEAKEESVVEGDTYAALPSDNTGSVTDTETESGEEEDSEDSPGFWTRVRSFVFGKASPKTKAETSTETSVVSNTATGTSEGIGEDGRAVIPPFDSTNYNLEVRKVSKGIVEIRVEEEETLSHYVDWARVSSRQIRRMNRIGRRGNIRIGQRLRLPLNEPKQAQFEVARLQFHQAIEEDFYESYRVTGWSEYEVKRGDSLLKILQKAEVPIWLLRKRNPGILKTRLNRGEKIEIPDIEPLQAPPPLSEQLDDDSLRQGEDDGNGEKDAKE